MAGPHSVPPPSGSGEIRVIINGTVQSIREGTLDIKHQAYSASTASFQVRDPAGNLTLEDGMEVLIDRDRGSVSGDTVPFSGVVGNHKIIPVVSGGRRYHQIECTDHTGHLTKKRLVTETFDGITVDTAVNRIITNYLAAESVQAGPIGGSGTTIDRLEYSDTPAFDVLNDLAEMAGGALWTIYSILKTDGTVERFLQFAAGNTSSITFTPNNVKYGTVEYGYWNPEYRTVQTVRGGPQLGGDPSDIITATVEDAAEVTARGNLSGDSGRIERVASAPWAQLTAEVTAIAQAKLDHNKRKSQRLQFETSLQTFLWSPQIIGVLVNVNFPEFGLGASSMQVESVTVFVMGNGEIHSRYSLVDGLASQRWEETFGGERQGAIENVGSPTGGAVNTADLEAKTEGIVSVTAPAYGAVGDGSTDDRAAIAAADSDVTTAGGGTLYFPPGTYRIASNITIANTMHFAPGAALRPNAAATVTVSKVPEAGPDEVIFAGPGSYSLTGKDRRIYANWWAANGSSTTPNADFALRWNAMWAAVGEVAEWVGCVGDQNFASPIDCTNWTPTPVRPRVCDFGGGTHTYSHSGECVIDRTGSRQMVVQNGHFDAVNQASHRPKVGVLIARDSTDTGMGPIDTSALIMKGKFSVAALLSCQGERSEYDDCEFLNGFFDAGDSTGRPAVILSLKNAGLLGVSSPFQTVSTTASISSNGHLFRHCRMSSDNGISGIDTGSTYKNSTIIIDGVRGVTIPQDNYVRSNGHSAIHVMLHNAGVAKLNAEPWVESWNGDHAGNADYIVSVAGPGGSGGEFMNATVAIQWCNPDVNEILLSNIRRIRDMVWRSARETTGHLRHGLDFADTNLTDLHNVHWVCTTGTIDLSGLSNTSAVVVGEFYVISAASWLPPGGNVDGNWRVYFGSGLGSVVREQVQTISGATPSVAAGSVFQTNNAGATTMTDLSDGSAGQRVTVIFGDSNTTVDFTASGLKGNAGADWSPTTGDHMSCVYNGTDWYCDISDNTA